MKWLAALLLPLGGWWTVAGAAAACVWFLRVEIQFDYKHHTIFLGLCCALTALAGPGGLLFSPLIDPADIQFIRWAALILLTQLYLSSALIKALSPSFVSGRVLANLFSYLMVEQHRFRHSETRLPKKTAKLLASSRIGYRMPRAVSLATIACEVLVVPLLWIPATRPIAMALGLMMHMSFHAILPYRLLPFSISALTLYLVVQI